MSEHEVLISRMFEGNKVRAALIDDEPWFVAKDVCAVLGLKNSREALTPLDDDEKSVVSRSVIDNIHIPNDPNILSNVTNSNVRDWDAPNHGLNIVNEPGLYRLIFRSRRPEARRFKRWVFHEVLPSIRRTGKYDMLELYGTGNDIFRASEKFLRKCGQFGKEKLRTKLGRALAEFSKEFQQETLEMVIRNDRMGIVHDAMCRKRNRARKYLAAGDVTAAIEALEGI